MCNFPILLLRGRYKIWAISIDFVTAPYAVPAIPSAMLFFYNGLSVCGFIGSMVTGIRVSLITVLMIPPTEVFGLMGIDNIAPLMPTKEILKAFFDAFRQFFYNMQQVLSSPA